MEKKIELKIASNKNQKPKTETIKKEFEKPPMVPGYLKDDKYASAEWKRITKELIAKNILSKLDLAALEILCKSYSRWRRLEEELDRLKDLTYNPSMENVDYIQQRPEVSMAMNYAKQYKTMCTEFGLTPASRHKLFEEKPNNENKPSPMQAILNGG